MFYELYLLTWNPLIDGIVGGGLFSIIGGLIGGLLAFRSQREQRKEETRGAIRAVAVEVIGNASKIAAIMAVLRRSEWQLGFTRTSFSQEAFDNYLAHVSLHLSLDQLIILFRAYVGLPMVEHDLEKAGSDFNYKHPPESSIAGLLRVFAPMAEELVSAIRMLRDLDVWKEKERLWLSIAVSDLLADDQPNNANCVRCTPGR